MAFRNPLNENKDFWVTTAVLIAFNCLLWFGMRGSDTEDVFRQYALIPSNLSLMAMFTACFLHTSLFHLLGNMFLLWLFGRRVEKAVGSIPFFFYYLGSGFAAAIMHLAIVFAFLPPEARLNPAVGSSGAIAGILGVYAVRYYRDRFALGPIRLPASIVLLGWLLLQVLLGITSLYVDEIRFWFLRMELREVGYWAHLGGFIFGMGLAQLNQLSLEAHKEYLLYDAENSYRMGTLRDVAQDFQELADCDPDDPFAYAELGRTHAMLNEPEASIANYEKAIDMYLKEKRNDLALERFREMRTSWPDALLSPRLQFTVGCKLEDAGAYEEAVEVLHQLALGEIARGEAEMAMLRVGEIYLTRLHRPRQARETFRNFLRLWPESDWKNFAEQALSRIEEQDSPPRPSPERVDER